MTSLSGGSLNACSIAERFSDVSTDYHVDPIGAVFVANADAARLEAEAFEHGFPSLEHDGEQRFWEIGGCTFEDVDAGSVSDACNPTPLPPFCDVKERWHFRAEVGAEGTPDCCGSGHTRWGTFAAATPHFDDDDNYCGHFVPEVFPYPDDFSPPETGSGFDAGRKFIWRVFVDEDGYHSPTVEYWGNVRPIPQSCGDNQWPASRGYVYFVEIPE